jgi:hypothetical protein
MDPRARDLVVQLPKQSKAKLHELCRVMGLPGKPDGISGEEIEKYYRDGHIRELPINPRGKRLSGPPTRAFHLATA